MATTWLYWLSSCVVLYINPLIGLFRLLHVPGSCMVKGVWCVSVSSVEDIYATALVTLFPLMLLSLAVS